MKSLIDFYREVAADAAAWCCTSTSDYDKLRLEVDRDVAYISRRVESEGMEFLTITLPNFRRGLERALDRGSVTDESFPGYKLAGGRSKLPKFMGWLLRLIFDNESGALLDAVNIEAIRAVRLLAGLFEKINLECSDARKDAALTNYIEIEKEVARHAQSQDENLYRDLQRVGALLYASTYRRLDYRILTRKLMGKHGPGKTADRILGNQKWDQRTWPWRLEENGFPHVDFLLPNASFYNEAESITFLEPGEELPVKVVLVPKTLKTPRVIAIEPTAMQYAQQAVAYELVQLIRDDELLGRMLDFNDQGPNQELARMGSITGDLATLDLSEASDRVSNRAVAAMLEGHLLTSDALQASRSYRADVPGHGVIPLSKFASMGSALCFPVEAMVFLAVVFIGVERAQGRRLTVNDIRRLNGDVRVYGDDIIVPVRFVQDVIDSLEDFGLKVNHHKSFWTGKFRESCGKEYWMGQDVSTVKVRSVFPRNITDASEIISTVSLRNQMYNLGYWRTASWLDDQMNRVLRGRYPTIGPDSPLLGRESCLVSKQSTRYFCHDYHVPLEKGYVVRSVSPVNAIDGMPALLKCFSKRGDEPFEDVEHLLRSGRPRVVSIKPVTAPVS